MPDPPPPHPPVRRIVNKFLSFTVKFCNNTVWIAGGGGRIGRIEGSSTWPITQKRELSARERNTVG